jgi:hypothetical protein
MLLQYSFSGSGNTNMKCVLSFGGKLLVKATNGKGKVKLSLCLTKHYVMKTDGGVDI